MAENKLRSCVCVLNNSFHSRESSREKNTADDENNDETVKRVSMTTGQNECNVLVMCLCVLGYVKRGIKLKLVQLFYD